MKALIFYITIFDLQYLIFSIVPLWNFEKTAINLTLPYSDTFTKKLYDKQLTLNKTIIRSKDSISLKNIITIINNQNQLIITNKDWDNIESFYEYDNNYYICPKGKYNMNKCYRSYNNEVKCDELSYINDNNQEWELKCFAHYNHNLITAFYLNTSIKIQSYNFIKPKWMGNFTIHEGLLDFKWTTDTVSTNKYLIFAIGMNGEEIDLFLTYTTYNGNEGFTVESIKTNKVYKSLTYKHACFKNDNLYFITYNNKEFISGFKTLEEKITESYFDNIKMNINENSPLKFYDEITINKINFIEESQYVYYNISTDKNETYYGIIDIESNKIIYNTNKELSVFKPFSSSSMLAISGSSAYLICTFNDGNKCIYKCDNNNPLIDTTKPNSCGNVCSNFTLIPENICIESCNENIYTIKDNQCGLCKDIDKENPFKVINTTGCIKEKPENSYYVKEKLNLIACDEGYIFENGICKQKFTCDDKCKTCKDEPKEGNQNCLFCKDENDFLQEGNCINECTEGFYDVGNKTCLKCDGICKTCEINSNNCKSCIDGKYLENNTCIDCHEKCQTCEKGGEDENQNCLTCKYNDTYLINADGYNKNCVENCSDYNLTFENKFCVNITNSSSDDSGKQGESSNEKPNYMVMIFFILIAILLIVLILIFFKRCHRKNDLDLMDNIKTELKDKIVD